jgi:hypothetical protein
MSHLQEIHSSTEAAPAQEALQTGRRLRQASRLRQALEPKFLGFSLGPVKLTAARIRIDSSFLPLEAVENC